MFNSIRYRKIPPGQFHRDASARLAYEIQAVDQLDYQAYAARIVEHFGLRSVGDLIAGPGEMFCDYTDGSFEIGLAWDRWSGFIVTANTRPSEALVRRISIYLGYDPKPQSERE